MRLYDRPADRQTIPVRSGLEVTKWIEELVQLLCRNSNTGIYHRNQEVTAVILLRLDRKFTWRVYALHALNTIEHEIHQDLL